MGHSLTPVYDHDLEELVALGWEEFIARQWESIFTGYRAMAGLRRICRRWSDLFEIGLGCSQELADLLVRRDIIDRADRDLEGLTDAGALAAGMAGVVADVREDLRDLEHVREISLVEHLTDLLPSKVGSPLSVRSQIAPSGPWRTSSVPTRSAPTAPGRLTAGPAGPAERIAR